VILLCILKRVN